MVTHTISVANTLIPRSKKHRSNDKQLEFVCSLLFEMKFISVTQCKTYLIEYPYSMYGVVLNYMIKSLSGRAVLLNLFSWLLMSWVSIGAQIFKNNFLKVLNITFPVGSWISNFTSRYCGIVKYVYRQLKVLMSKI